MSATAQYASNAKMGSASVTTGDTSRTAPTVANTGQVTTAKSSGARIDRIVSLSTATGVASMLRLWMVEGFPGELIASMTFSGTTITVTTSVAHGRATGELVTVQGTKPSQYNVKSKAITVTGATSYTYVADTAPTVAATTLGEYSITPATPSFVLLREIPTQATVPSSSVQSWNSSLSEYANPELMPIIVPPGFQLRTSVNDTQTSSSIVTSAFGGDM